MGTNDFDGLDNVQSMGTQILTRLFLVAARYHSASKFL